jgi:superfamily II DNA or RNA helicase
MQPMSDTLSFQGGTLVISQRPQSDPPGVPFQWIKGRWRCEGYHYPSLPHLDLRDTVPRWQRLDCMLDDTHQPHDYQQEAVAAWERAGHRGSIVLPTGAGKTFVAIQAIHRANRSTLVVAPTIDLLHQWYARLGNALNIEIGVYYGGEKIVLPVTVTTYHSAGDLIARHGNQFKLLIFDEVHHLPAPSWGETALMSPSPFRLGLTATYPDDEEMGDGRWQIDELIGPIVYQKRVSDLVGKRLAEYRTERIRINLTDDERQQYEADFAIYAGFFRARHLRETHGAGWLRELTRLSAFEREARAALLARHRILRLLAGCAGKLAALEKLLRENIHEQILVFTESNDTVYTISRRHLIPALTHETKAAERKRLLEAFRRGEYPAIVTSKVLNEGIDVPEAKIAIVLGGTSSAREYIQRLGRVLRKTGSRKAVLYEVIARDTVDEGRAQRRRPKARAL